MVVNLIGDHDPDGIAGCQLDIRRYPAGFTVSDDELEDYLRAFHGHSLLPRGSAQLNQLS